MIKEFLLRQMLKSQLKNVPTEQQEQLMAMVSKNPELFQKIAMEAQEKMKGGQDQMSAVMSVVQKYQSELSGLMGK